jgi:Zn finger protein HypA/HybF involved in hydrogenase expression
MHELSIALGIIDAACEEADRRGGARVVAVHLRLGKMAGVVQECLSVTADILTGRELEVTAMEIIT